MRVETTEILEFLQQRQRERGGSEVVKLITSPPATLIGIRYGDGMIFPEVKMRAVVKQIAGRAGPVLGEVAWAWKGETLVGADIEVEDGG